MLLIKRMPSVLSGWTRTTTTTTTIILLTLTWCPPDVSSVIYKCPGGNDCVVCCCELTSNKQAIELSCPNVYNQGLLNDYVTSLKTANNNPATLEFESLNFNREATLNLDLTPFAGCSIKNLEFNLEAQNLEGIKPYSSGEKIKVVNIKISKTHVTLTDVDNLLSYCAPEVGPVEVSVSESPKIKSHQIGVPVISQLNSYRKVTKLSLEKNELEYLAGGAFVGPESLTMIDLKGNKIKSVEKKAFRFLRDLGNEEVVEVDLSENQLAINKDGNSFEPEFISYEFYGKKGFKLVMKNNRLETLPEDIFNHLYPTGPIYAMDLQGNPFVCDYRMKWMRSIPESTKPNIQGVDCTNSPGTTIFTIDPALLEPSASTSGPPGPGPGPGPGPSTSDPGPGPGPGPGPTSGPPGPEPPTQEPGPGPAPTTAPPGMPGGPGGPMGPGGPGGPGGPPMDKKDGATIVSLSIFLEFFIFLFSLLPNILNFNE